MPLRFSGGKHRNLTWWRSLLKCSSCIIIIITILRNNLIQISIRNQVDRSVVCALIKASLQLWTTILSIWEVTTKINGELQVFNIELWIWKILLPTKFNPQLVSMKIRDLSTRPWLTRFRSQPDLSFQWMNYLRGDIETVSKITYPKWPATSPQLMMLENCSHPRIKTCKRLIKELKTFQRKFRKSKIKTPRIRIWWNHLHKSSIW